MYLYATKRAPQSPAVKNEYSPTGWSAVHVTLTAPKMGLVLPETDRVAWEESDDPAPMAGWVGGLLHVEAAPPHD